jgi:hypothetical protein
LVRPARAKGGKGKKGKGKGKGKRYSFRESPDASKVKVYATRMCELANAQMTIVLIPICPRIK